MQQDNKKCIINVSSNMQKWFIRDSNENRHYSINKQRVCLYLQCWYPYVTVEFTFRTKIRIIDCKISLNLNICLTVLIGKNTADAVLAAAIQMLW